MGILVKSSSVLLGGSTPLPARGRIVRTGEAPLPLAPPSRLAAYPAPPASVPVPGFFGVSHA